MFSRIDILRNLKKGIISIKPFELKNLQPDSYKFRLDSEIGIPLKGKIDPILTKNYESFYSIKKMRNYILKPGEFILARTLERFSLSRAIAGMVSGRTGLARLGLSVIQTAPLIHAGHGFPKPRKIILELYNAGKFDVVLTNKMIIGEISFHELKTPSDKPYDSFGKYGKRKELDNLLPLRE